MLKAGGSDLAHTVRCDQFVRDWRSVPFFHEVRRQSCGKHIPPSTTVLEDAMLLPQAGMTMNLVARPIEGPPSRRCSRTGSTCRQPRRSCR